MIREKKKGMWLETGAHSQKDRSGWMIHTILAVLAYCIVTLVFMKLTGTDKLYDPLWAVIAGSSICFLYGISLRFQKQGWIYPAALLLLLIAVLSFREEILEGGRLFWNYISAGWTSKTGYFLPDLKTQMEEQQWDRCLILFSLVLSVPGALLCCMFTTRKSPFIAVLVSGLTLAGVVLFRVDFNDTYLPLILLSSVFLLISSGWERKKMPPLTFGIWSILTVAGILLISGKAISGVEEWASEISSSFHQEVHERRFETANTVLPEGDFSKQMTLHKDYMQTSDTNSEKTEEKVQAELIVNMEQPEEMYLRGYTGALFENDRWLELDRQVLADAKELLYWLNLNEFDVRTQFKGAVLPEKEELNLVTIQNVGACSRYYYVPYNLASATFLSAENLDPDKILSDGERSYGFFMIPDSSVKIGETLEHLQKSEDEEIIKYRTAESAYREFVYSNYMQVPVEAEELLAEQWNHATSGYGVKQEDLTREQAQACVRSFLEQCFEGETAAVGALPLQMAEGSSYQYATTAVLTLRHFGFPARYAEGYVITEEMIADIDPGTPIEVDGSCAGAWPEVYQDGIGWIPLELTAGIKAVSTEQTDGQSDEDSDPAENDTSSEELQETEQEETESELPEEKDDEMEIPLPDLLNVWTLLVVGLLLLLFILSLIIRRYILVSRRREKFLQEDPKEAIAFIFSDTVKVLEELGYDRGNGSMYTLYEPVREHFGEEYADLFGQAVHLNAQAVFSSKAMTEEQRETAVEFYWVTLGNLKDETKWIRRMSLKWIQCLRW